MTKLEAARIDLKNIVDRDGIDHKSFQYFLVEGTISMPDKTALTPVKFAGKTRYDKWNIVPHVHLGKVSSSTGIYSFIWRDKKSYMSVFISGIKREIVTVLYMGYRDAMSFLRKVAKDCRVVDDEARKKALQPAKLKTGIYYPGIKTNQYYNTSYFVLTRRTIKSVFCGKVFHPDLSSIDQDIDVFFADINGAKRNLRFNMPGIRKIMMIGEPGTGKTSIVNHIALKYRKEYCIGYCKGLAELIVLTFEASSQNVPVIAILDDAETFLNNDNSALLGFLDGTSTPICKKGLYVIFSSNKPQYIDNRIAKRPGRIDSIFHIGPLFNEYALACASQYFKGILNIDDEYTEIFNNMTGAQIKGLSMSLLRYCVSINEDPSKELLVETFRHLKESYKQFDKFVDEAVKDSKLMQGNHSPVGFASQDYKEENLPF